MIINLYYYIILYIFVNTLKLYKKRRFLSAFKILHVLIFDCSYDNIDDANYHRPWRSWITQQIPILKNGGSNPFGRAKVKAHALCVGFYFFGARDSKDERYRATVRWTVVTASDQAAAAARIESLRAGHIKSPRFMRGF